MQLTAKARVGFPVESSAMQVGAAEQGRAAGGREVYVAGAGEGRGAERGGRLRRLFVIPRRDETPA